MDNELLIALIVMWVASSTALVIFVKMLYVNDGEAFHPHCVDVEHRHGTFLVVNSKTVCKKDFAIKSISSFVAPRGSSSSKHFTVMCVTVSIAGVLGTIRWYYVGDASFLEMCLSVVGYGAVMLLAGFELDASNSAYLEDKLIVTGWLIERLISIDSNLELPFKVQPSDNRFLEFIRNSPEIYHLYEEDKVLISQTKAKRVQMWNYHPLWSSMHMLGAIAYVTLIPTAVILNDLAEEKVAYITGLTFVVFSFMGMLTGNYCPIPDYLKCWVITWNPFVREPRFMMKLKRSIERYLQNPSLAAESTPSPTASPTLSKRHKTSVRMSPSTHTVTMFKPVSHGTGVVGIGRSYERCGRSHSPSSTSGSGSEDSGDPTAVPSNHSEKQRRQRRRQERKEMLAADKALEGNMLLQYARREPLQYLRLVSQVMVLTETVAILTPSVAMGLQWMTALCHHDPPLIAIIDLISMIFHCLTSAGTDCTTAHSAYFSSCILRNTPAAVGPHI